MGALAGGIKKGFENQGPPQLEASGSTQDWWLFLPLPYSSFYPKLLGWLGVLPRVF